MKEFFIRTLIPLSFVGTLMILPSCSSSYSIASVEGNRIEISSKYDNNQDLNAVKILNTYKASVDSIMSPVIGKSNIDMSAYRPESPLSNLVADVLREATIKYAGREADVAVINMGGLRAPLPKGDVKFSNIFEITPFENTLCILTMKGSSLRHLFDNIASVRGEGLSGANLVISKDGKLISATVNGQPIDDNKEYKVATVDYLAEGNDKMVAFKEATDNLQPDGATLRQLFLDYVSNLTKEGKNLDSKVEGRIVVK